MNAKRQTVWLVSMLSLMVVLSAYYLFTEDVNELDLTTQELKGSEIKVDAVKTEGTNGKADAVSGAKTDASSLTKTQEGTNAAQSAKDSGAKASASGNAETAKKTDSEVLKQITAQGKSGDDFFAAAQMKRNEELAKQTEQWMTISLDSKKSTEEVAKALEELQKLQDLDAKITNLEDVLAKDYKNAIVLQENGRWKVVVQAEKLEKSEGVSIVDLVMNELNVGPEKVTVQFVR